MSDVRPDPQAQLGVSDVSPEPKGLGDSGIRADFITSLGIDTGDFAFLAEHPEAFVPAGRTTRFPFRERVSFLGTLNGNPVEAWAMWKQARMDRITVMEHQRRRDGEMTLIVQTLLNPVNVEFGVVVQDQNNMDVEISMTEFLYQIFRAGLPPDKMVTLERFSQQLDAINMNLGGQQILMTNHFGSEPDATAALCERFRLAGAVDVIDRIADPRRIREVYQFPRGSGDAPEVTYMEITSADRTQSQTGQGFLDFIDATYENFRRAVSLRKIASGFRAQLAENDALDPGDRRKLSDEKRLEVSDALANYTTMARTWANNASGVQQRTTIDPVSGEPVLQDIWDPQYAPMGRWTLLFGDEEYPVDLWKTGTQPMRAGDTIPADTAVVDTTAVGETPSTASMEEEPF